MTKKEDITANQRKSNFEAKIFWRRLTCPHRKEFLEQNGDLFPQRPAHVPHVPFQSEIPI